MGWRRRLVWLALGVATALGASSLVPARAAPPPATGAGWQLSTTDPANRAPTFVGNGYLGLRVPAAGMGDAIGPVPTQTQLAGFYGRVPGSVEQRADIPTWSTLAFSDGATTYGQLPVGTVACASCAPAPPPGPSTPEWQGTVSNYVQTLDLRRGTLTTRVRWTSPGGHTTDLSYQVFPDRARPHVAVVRLVFTPRWNGAATVTDLLDGTDTGLTVQGKTVSDEVTNAALGQLEGTDTELSVGSGLASDPSAHLVAERITGIGTGIEAGLASVLEAPAGSSVGPAIAPAPETIGQQATVPVVAGRSYTVTKYVGVSSSHEDPDPLRAAQADARGAETTGFARLVSEHEGAWGKLWRTDIEINGDAALQAEVRAGLFYLLESARAGVAWSLSPAGLSSPNYNGHVFWDAETWMYPPLLVTHPEVAADVVAYRSRRLATARRFAGARFPWESAVSGDDETPKFADTPASRLISLDTGQDEQHITSDVALAVWQYYLATADRGWLATSGWPVLDGAARFWASRATPDASGRYHITHVMGPDEYRDDVNDSAYTNVAAAQTLRKAGAAAAVLGVRVPASWSVIAAGLLRAIPFDVTNGVHREDDTYNGQTIKQADVVMLQYPWGLEMSPQVASADLHYYLARTDPAGPSMTDAINAIDAAALGSPGCAADFFLQRSAAPFVRGSFDQFSETPTGGAFTFITGVGGFLQEFLFGFSGLRWGDETLIVSPTLPPELAGVTLRDLAWRGRRFTLRIGPQTSAITVTGGPAMPVTAGGRTTTVAAGDSLELPTRRPDLAPSDDLARCRPVTASSADPSHPPVGAVDGDTGTAWQANGSNAWLQVDLGADRPVGHVDVDWAGAPATVEGVLVSPDGRAWRPAGVVDASRGTSRDTFTLASVTTRYLRLQLVAPRGGSPPAIAELRVTSS